MKKHKALTIIISLIFACFSINAQISIGLKSGAVCSKLTDLQNRKLIGQNATYEVENLNSMNYGLELGYSFKKKVSLNLTISSYTTGFRENAVINTLNHLSGFSDVPYYKQFLFDNTFDFRFEYLNYNLNIGYSINDNLKIKIGGSFLARLSDNLNPNYFTISRYQSVINLYQLKQETFIDIKQNDFDPYFEYHNDIALSFAMNYTIYRGLYLEISYLRGLKQILEFPTNNKTYNQAITFNIGYQWAFKH